jgi:hypothetical protein
MAIPSNLPARHKLPQRRLDTGLPSGAAAAQMLYGIGVEPDFLPALGASNLGRPRREGFITARKAASSGGLSS